MQNISPGGVNVQLDVINPIVGSGSLSMHPQGGSAEGAHLYLGGSFSKGFTKGQIRTLVNSSAPQTIRSGFGIYFMQNQLDMVNNASSTYAFFWCNVDQGAGASNFNLQKITATTADLFDPRPISTHILSGSNTFNQTLALNQVLPMQVQWNLDQAQLGGIRITCSLGNPGDLNFNNLSTIYDLVDTVSPFTTSVAEGIGCEKSAGGFSGNDGWRADNTRIQQLV